MNKEELKQEARQKALEWNGEKINGKYNRPPIANWSCYEKGYLAGAEPREKRIAELEQKLEQAEKDLADYQFNYPTIKELQKENAELKEKLIKAKEIIADFESRVHYRKVYVGNITELMSRAEQFLMELHI